MTKSLGRSTLEGSTVKPHPGAEFRTISDADQF